MAAVYLGGSTVGATIPGAALVIETVGDALEELHATVDAQLVLLGNVLLSLDGQVDALAAAKIAIRIPAIADFQAQLDASVDLSAGLTAQLSNPAAYLQGLLNAIAELQLVVPTLVPTVELNAQLDASVAVGIQAQAKIAAVDLELAALVTIGAAIAAAHTIVGEIRAALSAAVAAVLGALGAFFAMHDQLAVVGAHAFLYDGPLSGLGAAIDAVSGGTGISGGTNVRAPLVLVRADDASAVGAVNAIFRTS